MAITQQEQKKNNEALTALEADCYWGGKAVNWISREQQLSVQVCDRGCYGALDVSADIFQSQKRAIILRTKTIQVLLHEETFFTAILLRSAPHTRLSTGEHMLAG